MRVPRQRSSIATPRELALGVAAALALAGGAVAVAPGDAAAAGQWRLEQPAPPAGSPYKVPLGRPGDLSCWSATRCLLAVEGNAVVARGLEHYYGFELRQLSTVCGGGADTTRIAWAGPTEFWTISTASLPRIGIGLCRFRDGQVIASYSTAPESADPFRTLTAAACNGPNDCWFGGVGSRDASGQRAGAFHLHWDGATLNSSYAAQGRGVSDLLAVGGIFYATTFVGAQREDRETAVSLVEPETFPDLIHTIAPGGARTAVWGPRARSGTPFDGSELLAADGAGGPLWFVGGGAASGPNAPRESSVARPPLVALERNGRILELPLDETPFGDQDRFVDVAAIPGEDAAWVASQPYGERGSATARARVARISADGGAAVTRLPAGGAGRGAAARVEFTGPDEGWMITTSGWLFHFTDGQARGRDGDPAFARVITYRPNEALAQSIPDAPPVDDSQLFAPPAIAPEEEPEPPETIARRVRALMFKMSRPQVDRRLRLRISFSLRRTARVQLQARRNGRVVARTPLRRLRPGRHTLRLQLNRRRWPDRLRFRTIESRSTR